MKILECASCKMSFGIPDEFQTVMRQTHHTFYCPAGHHNFYPQGETEADKLRRERDRLIQDAARKDDELKAAWATANQQAEYRKEGERRLAAAKGQITKIKKRAANGVCPCCNRTFSDLGRHMHTKHPNYVSEPDASVTVN